MNKNITPILTNKQKLQSYFIILMFILTNFFEMLSIGLIIPLMEILQGQPSNFLSFINEYVDFKFQTKIIQILIIFFILVFLKNIFLVFTNYYQAKFIILLSNSLIKKVYANYLNKNLIDISKTHSSKLFRDIITETGLFTNNYVGPYLTLISNILLISFIITLLLFYNFQSSLIILVAAVFAFFIFRFFFGKQLKELGKKRQNYQKTIFQNINDGLNIIKEIRLLNLNNFFIDKIDKTLKKLLKINIKRILISSIPKASYEMLFLSLLILIVLLNTNNQPSLVTTLGLYVAATFRLMPSLNAISVSYNKMKFSQPTIDIIKRVAIDQPYNNEYELTKEENIEFKSNILIKNLNLSFDNLNILENCNLEIKSKDKIGILGESGIGKTTFLNVIMGLIEPKDGEVLVDEKNIKKNQKGWFNLISYVPQNVIVFDESLQFNVALGDLKTDFDKERYDLAIKKAQLVKLLKKLENKSDQNLGENGSKISQGEKQRIGIARAFYRQSKVLILDESTNFLDAETEKDFLNELRDNCEDLTIIFVSHKVSSLEICNKRFILRNKQLVEQTI